MFRFLGLFKEIPFTRVVFRVSKFHCTFNTKIWKLFIYFDVVPFGHNKQKTDTCRSGELGKFRNSDISGTHRKRYTSDACTSGQLGEFRNSDI